MSIALILVYCLSADPGQCIEIPQDPPADQPYTIQTCAMGGMVIGASEAQQLAIAHEHPGFAFHSWRCDIDKPKRTGA